MKKLTKILTLCMVLALVLCMAPAVFAAEPDGSATNPYAIDSGWYDFNIAEVTKAEDSTYFKMTVGSTGYMSFTLNGVFKPDDVWTPLDNVQEVVVSIYANSSDEWPIEDIMIPADATAPVISSESYEQDQDIYFAVNVTSTSYDCVAGFVDIAGAYGGTAELPFNTDFADGASSVVIGQGVTMYYTNRMWNNYQGVVISANPADAISDDSNAYTTVYANGKTYTDEDKDGVIELPIEAAGGMMMQQMAIGIENKSNYMMRPVTYTITLKETPQAECAHATKSDVPAKDPDCHVDGYVAHKKCDACGTLFDATTGAETTMAELATSAQYALEYQEKTYTCTQDGNIEHWHCEGCGKNYEDAEGATELTSIAKEAPGHNMDHVEAQESADCQSNGWVEYYFCSSCPWPDSYYTDEDGNNPIDYDDINYYADHVWVIDDVTDAPDCANPGVGVAHCEVCNEIDEAYEIPADPAAHPELEHNEAVSAECHVNGVKEHWYCETCDCYFTDSTGKNNVASLSLTIPYTATVEHVEPSAAGCHQNGTNGYYHCTGCDAVFKDAALTIITNVKNEAIPCDRNNVEHVKATEVGCHQNGMAEFWHCKKCDMVYADEALTKQTNVKNLTIPYDAAHVTHVPAKAATDTENGNIEYWICNECKCVFLDAGLTKVSNIKNVTIPSNPKTGDTGIVLALGLALACMTGAVVLTKKKF